MKKTVSAILVFVLVIGSLFTLASCNKLSGKYRNSSSGTTIEFSSKKVVITQGEGSFGINVSKTYEAEYTIDENEDGERTITFTYSEGESQHPLLKGTKSFSEGEEEGVKYVKIGILQYTKVD